MSYPYIAALHRGETVVWTRHYARFSNAVRRAVELAMMDGEPGDVIEFAMDAVGHQIGTMKLHAGGILVINWNNEQS